MYWYGAVVIAVRIWGTGNLNALYFPCGYFPFLLYSAFIFSPYNTSCVYFKLGVHVNFHFVQYCKYLVMRYNHYHRQLLVFSVYIIEHCPGYVVNQIHFSTSSEAACTPFAASIISDYFQEVRTVYAYIHNNHNTCYSYVVSFLYENTLSFRL